MMSVGNMMVPQALHLAIMAITWQLGLPVNPTSQVPMPVAGATWYQTSVGPGPRPLYTILVAVGTWYWYQVCIRNHW